MRPTSLRRVIYVVYVLLLAVVVPRPAAQVPAAPTGRETTAESVARYPLAEDMPVDPEVLVGALENGLRFYIRPNGRPARQAELRLVVRAGSVLEDDEQRGLAHFVEHMQFEGSRNFPGQGINEFLASLGLSLGADANAQTSFDDTQYMLRVPTDRPGVLDRAMTVLEDFAGGATFDIAGIERQRPIVLEEWRRNLGAIERTGDRIRRVQLEGSRYADRVPIGVPEVIQTAPREQLVRFYRDWYRPNLMAVIVVGDVVPRDVAAMIRRHFSSLTNPEPERPRPNYDVPERDGTRYAVVADRENTATVVELSNLRPARSQGTVGGYRDIMRDGLFSQMLGARLSELTQSVTPPFLDASVGRALFPAPKTRDQASMQALVPPGGVARGLDALVTELQRVAQFGFTATELDRAKQARLASYERSAAESPDRESESRADEYSRAFLQGEALPTIWQELAFHRRFIPEITLAEMNALVADWFPEQNRLVIVTAPDAPGVALPSESELAAVVTTARARRLERYVDAGAGQPLLPTPPAPGRVVSTIAREAGITEWRLSNGATVILQPTTLRTDQILFRAIAPGGTSLATDEEFPSARVADDVIPAGGVAGFTSVVLDKALAGKAVVVRPYINEVQQGMAGGSTPQDLETLFQLLYLRFTQPRADPVAFASLRAQALGLLANQAASPDVVFAQTIDATLSGGHVRRAPETPESVAQWDLDRALAFYRARFSNAANFTFIFVGSLTPEMLQPFVETYVASLPSSPTRETWRDLGIAPPAGIVERVVQKGIAPRSEVSILFTGAFQFDDANRLALRTLGLLLQARLNDAIREELGATYSISVEQDAFKNPTPQYRIRINWSCDPARVQSLVLRVFEEVSFVRGMRLSANQMVRIRELLARDLDRNRLDNGYLLNQMARRIEDGDAMNLDVVAREAEAISLLSGLVVERAVARYLDPANYVRVTLMPE